MPGEGAGLLAALSRVARALEPSAKDGLPYALAALAEALGAARAYFVELPERGVPVDPSGASDGLAAARTGAHASTDVRVDGQLFGRLVIEAEDPSFRIGEAERQAIDLAAGLFGQALARLRASRSHRFTQLAMESADEAMFVVDEHARILAANACAAERLGYTRDELLSMRIHDIDPDYRMERWPAHWAQLRESGVLRFETTHRHKRGTVIPIEVSIRYFELDGVGYCCSFMRDLRPYLEATEALRVSRERFALAVRGTREGIWDYHPPTGEAWFSDRFKELLGFAPDELPDTLEMWLGRLHPQDRDAVTLALEAHLSRGLPYDVECRMLTREGEYRWFHARGSAIRDETGAAIRMAGAIADVTERRRLEAMLLQSQKMEAIGRLAGGVAHDFNNMLSVIHGYAEILTASLPLESPAQRPLAQIREATDRATDVTRQLLSFARKQRIEPKVVDLNDLLARAALMLAPLVGEDVEVLIKPGPGRVPVRIDVGQFEQVLANLAVNARDAMPNGGVLLFETETVQLDASYASTRTGVEPGTYVRLAVSDSGHGMEDDVLEKVFEPFFTTKERGRGTGLGLASCEGIVRQAGGHIDVRSEIGVGTTFLVYIPRAMGTLEPIAPSTRAQEKLPTGMETILLVEDEAQLRAMLTETLARLGYEVTAASNAEEAIRCAEGLRGHLDLLVTDVILPGANGAQIAERMRALHPECRVLFISGYTENVVIERGVLNPGTLFLPKPLTPTQLARKVRDVLDAER